MSNGTDALAAALFIGLLVYVDLSLNEGKIILKWAEDQKARREE